MECVNSITRTGKFDAGHRVMHQMFKCRHLHGHEYHYELSFCYKKQKSIGYPMDFGEIKRIGDGWIRDYLDHVFIVNPKDEIVIDVCKKLDSKLYIMNLIDKEKFCNPTAENIAKELFFSMFILLNTPNFFLKKVRLYETVNCFVDCNGLDKKEWQILKSSQLYKNLLSYKEKIGTFEYDERCIKENNKSYQ